MCLQRRPIFLIPRLDDSYPNQQGDKTDMSLLRHTPIRLGCILVLLEDPILMYEDEPFTTKVWVILEISRIARRGCHAGQHRLRRGPTALAGVAENVCTLSSVLPTKASCCLTARGRREQPTSLEVPHVSRPLRSSKKRRGWESSNVCLWGFLSHFPQAYHKASHTRIPKLADCGLLDLHHPCRAAGS